jgi:peptide/nickel transport system ATP-binding protein
MYLGRVVEVATRDDLFTHPKHPYTKALLSSVPIPDPIGRDQRKRILLTGDVPSPANPPSGCRFHPRCPEVRETRCADEVPELRDLGGGEPSPHLAACHWAESHPL